MRREIKSLRIGVHHANAVVWEPVYRTRLNPVSPRPNQSLSRMSCSMRRWLPFAADVITATGVTCRSPPCTL
eukprot:17589-Pelagococcus_subviridis.AAC.1